MKIEDMTLEEKVDAILKYQKRLHHMAILKVIFSALTFIILVVLPVIGIYYLSDYIANSVGLSMQEIGETLQRAKSLTDFGEDIDNLKSFLN